MRIAYVCSDDLRATGGVTLKIGTQMAAWRDAGHEVNLYSLTNSNVPSRLTSARFFFDSDLDRAVATAKLTRAVSRFEPDVVYLRYDRFLPPFGGILRRFPTIVEINGDDREEARLKSRRALLYNGINRRAVLRKARGLVCVTDELAASARLASFSGPTIVIPNGVDLAAVRQLPPPDNARPRLVFLGTRGESWQGVDKVGALARHMPDCDFDVIGFTEHDLPEPPPANLTAHGRLSRADYETILANADVGIGTLALHRKRMEEASPLKVREYLAHGLPVIAGYVDADFAGSSPWFILRIPNTDDNIHSHRAEIRAFVQHVRGRRVSRPDVEQQIGTHAKEHARLAFMRNVARGEPMQPSRPPQVAAPAGTVADPLG